MNDRELETRLRGRYRARAGETEPAPLSLRHDVTGIPRTATSRSRLLGRGRGVTLLAAAAVLVLVGGALTVGSGVLRLRSNVPPPAPSSGPVAIASPDATPSPSESASPTVVPSATTVPITWTRASLKQDWPAPVRPEPAGGASVAPMPPTYIDPSGDAGSNATSYVDIRDVTANTDGVSFDLMSKPPDVDPSQAWTAYGLVVDTNGDGVPDWRYGIDNVPSTMGQGEHRAWRTDLHTGRTEFDPDPEPNAWGGRGDPLYPIGATQFGTGYPAGPFGTGPRFRLYYTADTTGGGTFKVGAKLDKPFYVWAAAIVDGRVLATDYAPDTGWLVPTVDGTTQGDTGVGPGTEVVHVAPLRISMNIPAGWTTAGPDAGRGLQFLSADHPAKWACDASGHFIEPPVGPTVDDLVTFLAHQPMIQLSENTDVTVDSYRGKYLEYTTSYNGDNNCEPPAWPFDTYTSTFHQVWILDVDGVRLVVDASAPKASDAVKAEFRQIVDSIAIGP